MQVEIQTEVTESLTEQFRASSFDARKEEQKKLKQALGVLEKTPSGRETLNSLKKLGYTLVFEPGLKANGICHWTQGTIGLNPSVPAENIPSLLVHETRHAVQLGLYKEGADLENAQAADMFKFRRAIEADACAHQSAFCHEAVSLGYKTYVPEGYEPVFETYCAEINKGDKKQAMNAAFKKWYDLDIKMKIYDDYYTSGFCEVAQQLGKTGEAGFFKGTKTDKEWSDICLFEGKPYVEPDFLSSPRAFSLHTENKKLIMEAAKQYAQATGTQPDTSVLSMHTRRTPYSSEKTVSNAALKKQALNTVLNQRQGGGR